MNLLLDTHILLWSAQDDARLSGAARQLINDPGNVLWFSVASIWEVAIKRAKDRQDFQVDAAMLRSGLLSNGYQELVIEGRHILLLPTLPPLHADPFDRILIAQARAEGMVLLTADRAMEAYGKPVRML